MKNHWSRLLFIAFGTLYWAGCRTPQVVTQLERENYALESKIWELVDLLEQKQAELDACREELARLKNSGKSAQGGKKTDGAFQDVASLPWAGSSEMGIAPSPRVADPESSRQIAPPPIEISPPKSEVSADRAFAPRSSLPRTVQPADSQVQPPLWLAPEEGPASPAPQILPPASKQQAAPLGVFREQSLENFRSAPRITEEAPSSSERAPGEASVEPQQLLIPAEYVGGRNYDGQPGDDGIALLIQPVDSEGAVLLEPATVTVVAVDPDIRGSAARVARWDLQPEELQSYLVDRANLRGFLLELPWPEAPPRHEHLKIFVRYTTSSGKKLEAQTDVTVAI